MFLSNFYLDSKQMTAILMKLISISFSLESQVSDYFYHIDNEINLPRKDKHLVQTRSQVRSNGIRLLEIHGTNKGLDPHMHPGKQKSFPIQLLTKVCLHIPFQSPELVKVEQD